MPCKPRLEEMRQSVREADTGQASRKKVCLFVVAVVSLCLFMCLFVCFGRLGKDIVFSSSSHSGFRIHKFSPGGSSNLQPGKTPSARFSNPKAGGNENVADCNIKI